MRLRTSTFGIFLGALLAATAARAGTVTLAWDPSPDASVAGYFIYAATNDLAATNLAAAPIRVDARTNTVCSVDVTNAGLWTFVATAYALTGTNRIESDPSNQVSVRFPWPPARMAVLVPQYAATLGSTNWQDLGFFRLKLGLP